MSFNFIPILCKILLKLLSFTVIGAIVYLLIISLYHSEPVYSYQPIMGLLTEGSPLSWEKTKEHAEHVRAHGIAQFINLYHRLKDRQGDVLKWGDEVSVI